MILDNRKTGMNKRKPMVTKVVSVSTAAPSEILLTGPSSGISIGTKISLTGPRLSY